MFRQVFPAVISLLFTDLEGSTRLAARAPSQYNQLLARHLEILRRCLARHGGREFLENGDGLCLAFVTAAEAAAFAVEAQWRLGEENWPAETGALKVRMALHTGEAEFRDGQYRGLAMNLTARLLAAANGGQVLCSEEAARSLEGASSAPLRSLGVYRLRGFERAEEIRELLWRDDLPLRPLRAEHARSHNLPVLQRPIIGRDAERAELRGWLDPLKCGERLVTLTGPGGIGKTRLAIETARDLLEAFNYAVALVSLVAVDDPNRIAEELRRALRISGDASLSTFDQLREAFGPGPFLLVLDNLEQLLPEGAACLQNLLRRIPGLRCLATSRVILGLPGERVFSVAPLAIPGEAGPRDGLSASGELFVQSARAVCPEFRVTEKNRSAVVRLCNLLEGMPLALELAAARTSVLSPREILAQIETQFTLLRDRHGKHPARHSSLEAAIDWSFHALPEKSREILAALSVFRGGFSLEAAIRVAGGDSAGETQAAVQNLRYCSLLTVEEGVANLRFQILETVRRYAAGQLREKLEAVQERHWRYFSLLAYDLESRLRHELDSSFLDRLEEEHANFLQVLGTSSTPIRRLRLATALHQFWLIRGYIRENRRWFNRPPVCQDARERSIVARALHAAGVLDSSLGHLWRAQIAFQRALALFEEAGMEENTIGVLHNLGQIAFLRGDYKTARRHHLQCIEISEALGDASHLPPALAMLGVCCLQENDLAAARHHLQRSLDLLRHSGDRATHASVLQDMGHLEFRSGDFTKALNHYSESLAIRRELKMTAHFVELYLCFAELADARQKFELSARLLTSAIVLKKRLRQPLSKPLKAVVLTLEENARQALGDSFFNRIAKQTEDLGEKEIFNIPMNLA